MSGLLTPAAVAERWNVSTRTVQRMIDTGQLRAVRFGPRLVRLRPEDVEAFEIAKSKAETPSGPTPPGPARDARQVALQARAAATRRTR